MAWTEITRRKYERKSKRYQSDMTEAEWALIRPLLRGAPRKWALREAVNAILYMLRTGCQWRMLPSEFPPKSTLCHWLAKWRDDGTWLGLDHNLMMQARERRGREASPTAGAIDTQSVRTTESGGPRGDDAGKKTRGRKREIIVDTGGHPVTAAIHPANVQDRDAAALALKGLRRSFAWLVTLFADAGCSGDKLRDALSMQRACRDVTFCLPLPTPARRGQRPVSHHMIVIPGSGIRV